MKKLLGIVLAVAMLFTLVISVPVSAEAENVALGKPVYAILNGGVAADANYWKPEFLTDGLAQDTTNGNALGWAFGTLKELGAETNVSAYIDLGAVYSVNSAVVVPMAWSSAATYPGAYEIHVSTDMVNWTKVGETGAGPKEGNAVYNFDAIEAQFVCLKATAANGVWADDYFNYNGFGDLQIFGTKVKDSDKSLHVYKNYTGDLVTVPPASAEEALGAPTVWTGHTSGSLEWKFTFNTDVSFFALNFPLSWGNYGAPLKFTLSKESDGTVVAEKTMKRFGDGGFSIDFGKAIPAGQYVLSVAITDDTLAKEGEYAFYNVIGHANGMLDEEYCLNTNGTDIEEAGAVEFYSFDNGRGFIKLGEEVQPATEPAGEYTYNNASFDSFFVNDVLNFGKDDGAASDKLDEVDRTVDGSDGSVTKLVLRGWIGFAEEIESFGYQVNGKNVFGDFAATTEDAVKKAGGENASRFQIEIDASALKGTNKIVAVVKLTNGAIVKLDETLVATGPATPPNTSFTFIGVPEEVPATGDMTVAMFAVIAVLAMGAAVVFMKKRAF